MRQIAKKNGLTYTIPAGYLSLREFAERTGFSTPGIRYYMKSGQLPAVKVGNRYYVDGNASLKLQCVVCGKRVGKLNLVSADGFRLAVVSLDYDEGEGQALVSREDLRGIANALRRAKRARIGFEPNGSLDGKGLILDTELIRYKLVSVNGNYPDWQKLAGKAGR